MEFSAALLPFFVLVEPRGGSLFLFFSSCFAWVFTDAPENVLFIQGFRVFNTFCEKSSPEMSFSHKGSFAFW